MNGRRASHETGAAASEYAIALAFIAVAVAAATALFDLTPAFAALSAKVVALVS